jgi:isopentenyl phosphate kinase
MYRQSQKTLVLIKLGGGLIAPKDWQKETADLVTIKRLVEEIKSSEKRVVIAVGSGNFGHKAVERYGIQDAMSVEKVRDIARKIGETVSTLLDGSVLLIPHKMWSKSIDGSSGIEKVLNEGKTPVVYGDVIEENEDKWVIYSGEKCLELILPGLIKSGWKVEKIIQVSKEEGVLDGKGKVVREISGRNWENIRKDVSGARGVDVTGGMVHKVLISLKIAQNYGIYTQIINGRIRGKLTKALAGEEVTGTLIKNQVHAGSRP